MLRDFIVRIREVAIAFVAAAICVAPLSSCGVKGPLKLPPPAAATSTEAPSAPSTAPSATPATKPPDVRP